MNATDELRRMLDERGVEWHEATPHKTKWFSPVLNGPVAVSEWRGKLVLDAGYVNVTPEQAIAATLGDDGLERSNDGVSRYSELFGTPERAALTFADFCDKCDKGECNDCPLDRLTDFCIGYDALHEWLRGDAE